MRTQPATVVRRRRPAARLSPTPAAPQNGDLPVTGYANTTRSSPSAARPFAKRWGVGRIVRWALGVALLLVLGYAGWVGYSFAQMQSRIFVALPPTPIPRAVQVATAGANGTSVAGAVPSPTTNPLRYLPKGRTNILVMGTDKRPNDPEHYARSDTMLLVNIDTISPTVRVMSIPRDLIVDIPGYGKNKVNAAYLFGEYYQEPGGGQALAVRTISQFFNVPVDYYATINFQGFQKVVDTVGGIDINVPYAIDDYQYPSDEEGDLYGVIHVHFDAGMQHMDGKTALRYARTRHADNDFMRSKRQLQIITALRQKATSLNLLPSLPSLIDQLGGMVETNLPFDQQLAYGQLLYGIQPSAIITSSIDSAMITAATLPDGSEGLKLNWNIAEPMLNSFFGAATAVVSPLESSTAGDSGSPSQGSGSSSGSSSAKPAVQSSPTSVSKARSTPTKRAAPTTTSTP